MAAERLIEILVPTADEEAVHRVVRTSDLQWSWHQSADGNTVFKLALPANRVEDILDPLEPVLEGIVDARLVVLPVEAILPRRSKLDEEQNAPANVLDPQRPKKIRGRLSREELYLDVMGWAKLNADFIVMTALSTVVASIGLAKDNAAVVLAAMVIAPLLGPNMALAVATTLGDRKLLFESLRTGLIGLSVAAVTAFVATAVLPMQLSSDESITASREILSRTTVDLADIVLGLAAGAAGAMAITSGVASSLVGVMVAVALLPPLVVTAGLLAQGQIELALGAGLLLTANLACVNLSALTVFAIQGVRPRGWWDSKRSARLTGIAVGGWALLLVALIGAVLWLQWNG